MPLLDQAARNKSLDNDYGTARAAGAPSAFEVALFQGNPAQGGVEVSGSGYARASLNSDDWGAAAGGVKEVTVTFPSPTDAWTTAYFWALYDPVGADWWDYAPFTSPLVITGAGSGPVVALAVFYNPA